MSEFSPHQRALAPRIGFFAAPLLAGALWLFVDLDPARPAVSACAAVAVLMGIWWLTEALPLAATALVPVVLFPLSGVMSAEQVAAQYFSDAIFLFIGGFLMALAIEQWGLHRRIALRALMLVGVRPHAILFGFMAITGLLSMWISNTAATMMMIAIALAVLRQIEELHGAQAVQRYAVGVLLGVAYGASAGGLATLVGTPTNMAFRSQFHTLFPAAPEISFARWGLLGVPVSLAFLLLTFGVLALMFRPPRAGLRIGADLLHRERAALGPMTRPERRLLALFLLLVVAWVLRADLDVGAFRVRGWAGLLEHGELIRDGTVATGVALLLFLLPSGSPGAARLADWSTAARLPWHIVLLFGGGFALARGFADSGLSQWVGGALGGLTALPPVVLLLILCTAVTFLTELTSNTATAMILLPVVASLAVSTGMNPLFLMVPVTLSCSCAFMMPVATPPNAIVFGSGRMRMADMVRAGLVLNVAGVALITLLMLLLGRAVFGIELGVMPEWAVPVAPASGR